MVLALGQDVNATVRFKHCMSTEYTHSHSQNYHTHKHTHTHNVLPGADDCWPLLEGSMVALLQYHCHCSLRREWGVTHSLLESNWSFSFTWFETKTIAELWLVSLLFINKTSFSLFTNRTSFGLFTNKLLSVCVLTKHIVYNSNHWPKHLQSFQNKERSNT